MVWSHNDQWMITGDHAGFIKYWQTNMNNVKMYQGHKEPVRSIRWENVALMGLHLRSKVYQTFYVSFGNVLASMSCWKVDIFLLISYLPYVCVNCIGVRKVSCFMALGEVSLNSFIVIRYCIHYFRGFGLFSFTLYNKIYLLKTFPVLWQFSCVQYLYYKIIKYAYAGHKGNCIHL